MVRAARRAFLSIDAILPNPIDPQVHNPYSYARNNPAGSVDPTGTAPSRVSRGGARGCEAGLGGGISAPSDLEKSQLKELLGVAIPSLRPSSSIASDFRWYSSAWEDVQAIRGRKRVWDLPRVGEVRPGGLGIPGPNLLIY